MAKRSDETLFALPETNSVSRGVKVRLDALLREAHSLRAVEKRLKEVKLELQELIQTNGLANEDTIGVRSGQLCCIVRFNPGRKTLDKSLLIDNGVSPEQIEASTREGEPYVVCELAEIGADGLALY